MSRKMVFGRYDYAAFLTFASYAMCSVVIPMCLVPLAKDLHFPLDEGGMGMGGAIQLGRSIPMTIMLILCGFIAARWGNRISVGVAVLFMASGILLASASPGYWFLFAALTIAGLGEGVLEGLATPLVNDLHEDEAGRYINFTHSFWSIGVLVTVLVSGALLLWGISWRFLAATFGCIAVIPGLLLLIPSKKKPFPKKEEPVHWKEVCGYAFHLFRTPRFWIYFAAIFLAGGGEFCLTFWTASFIQMSYAGSAWAAGVGTGAFALGMIVSRMGAGYFVREKNLGWLIVCCGIGAAVVSLFFPYLKSLYLLFPLLFLSGVGVGPFWASIQSVCAKKVSGDDTMIFIILSASGVPGCGIFSTLLGILGDHYGLRLSFFIVPVCFVLISVLIGFDIYLQKKAALKRLNGGRTAAEKTVFP